MEMLLSYFTLAAIPSWVASVFELSGAWLVGRKRKIGFVFNIIAGVLWVTVSLMNLPAIGLLLVCIPAFGINIINYRDWARDDKEKEQ